MLALHDTSVDTVLRYAGPIMLQRRLESRLWGGEKLGDWLGIADAPPQLAEVWQVYEHNRIIGGPFGGMTLAEVAAECGEALLGSRSFARYGADFPLLAKFMDAADSLSVQVHPDDAYARQFEAATGFYGKTEAWYILDARPGADLVHGLLESTDRASFAQAVADGTLLDHVRRVPVARGDTILVPAGTVHAINGGLTLFEIQQKSDLTYRLYDYDRRDAEGNPRPLHVERALDVIDFGSAARAKEPPRSLDKQRTILVESPYFVMQRWDLQAPFATASDLGSFQILTLIDGVAQLAWQGGAIVLRRGDSIVVPAALGAYQLYPEASATLLNCYVP